MVAGIIFLVLLLIVIGVCFVIYIRIRNKVRAVSKEVFGTEDIMEGFQRAEQEVEETPRSISANTSIYLPKIVKDFPSFHYDEIKTRADNILMSYLQAITLADASLLEEGTSELREALELHIQMRENQEERECFENIKIHRTELFRYRKAKGRCSVILQSAVEYIHYVEKDGKVVRGKKNAREQAKYNVEVMYIQDRDMIENVEDMGLASVCPHCGAPLPELGAKICKYCDCPIEEFNIRTWHFSKVSEC